MRVVIAFICTLLSAPGALMGLMFTFGLVAEPCQLGAPAWLCALHHVAGWLTLPAYLVAWIAYVSMVACWIGKGREHRVTLWVGTGAALGYMALAMVADGTPSWAAILVCTLPVLPATLLAAFLVWHFSRPGPAPLQVLRPTGKD